MKNWSGYLSWNPSEILYPESETAIQEIVRNAIKSGKKVRVIGTKHSFTPLCVTDQILVCLDKYQGIVSTDKENLTAVVKAGSKLNTLTELLYNEGMALMNMGDINQQSIAGSTSTGTHGTGTAFGNMSTQIIKLRFVNGLGEIVECSPTDKPDLFKAAQISLGTLGIITELTLQCIPNYILEMVIDKADLQQVLKEYPAYNQKHRNFEFYWFPHTDAVMTKFVNEVQSEVDESSFKNYFQEYVLENYAFGALCEIVRLMPSSTPSISRLSAKTIGYSKKVNHSYKVYATTRMIKFNEMEYNVPVEAYDDVVKDLIKCVNTKFKHIYFPIEHRFVQQDDIYLSPAHGRDSAYIACHVHHKKDCKAYFKALEDIFLAYDGRPHWGKMHTLTRQNLEKTYPKFDAFLTQRATHDPNEIFLTDYMKGLFC